MKAKTEILLVDDNPADLDLTREVLLEGRQSLHVATVADGVEATAYLRRQGAYAGALQPDLVLLDLNLPRKDGRTVLAEIKQDVSLRTIPVVIFTTSQAPHDIQRSYELGANCFMSKPGNLQQFIAAVRSMEDFWLDSASLPAEVNHE